MLISILLLLLACGITGFVYWDTHRALREIEIPILKSELPVGTKLEKKHLGKLKIQSKSAHDMGIVMDAEAIINLYVNDKISKERPLYRSNFIESKPKVAVNEQIQSGAITVTTDAVKSIGGLIKANSRVRVWILTKDSQGQHLESPIVLQNLKVLAVQSKEEENDLVSVTFEATAQQQQLLVNAEYSGEIHLALLPLNGGE